MYFISFTYKHKLNLNKEERKKKILINTLTYKVVEIEGVIKLS